MLVIRPALQMNEPLQFIESVKPTSFSEMKGQAKSVSIRFLTDLSRDKSARACLPLGRRETAPAQAGTGRLDRLGLLHATPCPTAFRLMDNKTDEASTGSPIRRF
jgi:hypothetical protein